MGLSEDGDENVESRFEDLAQSLNLDSSAKEDAWECFKKTKTNYTLEGDAVHWLACALYFACRKSVVQTVGRGRMQGNCVSLTRLLRLANLSFVEFLSKMKKWCDMNNIPREFREKVERLERNVAVSAVIFKKFMPIFRDVFQDPDKELPKPVRSRKQRRLPCNASDIQKFIWTVYIHIKANFPAIGDDLVNSYHLLLCAIDWLYGNVILANRTELLNHSFPGVNDAVAGKEGKVPADMPCVIGVLCKRHEGMEVEAMTIKVHWWNTFVKKLFDKNIFQGHAENLSGTLDINLFEDNMKEINRVYDESLLHDGDFDERIFLSDSATRELGTPAVGATLSTVSWDESANASRNLFEESSKLLKPLTPLTGRRYLKEKEADHVTPISTATQSVSRLHALLDGHRVYPSEDLSGIFRLCSRNPRDEIASRIKELSEAFCRGFTQQQQAADDSDGQHMDMSRKRAQLAECLYYKVLTNMMVQEQKRATAGAMAQPDFSNLLSHDMLHRCLFACCLEIVLFAYNSQRVFPWCLDMLQLSSYHFYKVIELLIRAEDGLSREIVKHLNHIEESILDSEAWQVRSPLWEVIKENGCVIPQVEEVCLPNQLDGESANRTVLSVSSPAVKSSQSRSDVLQSPVASDRFSSPAPGNAKRRLFGGAVEPLDRTSNDLVVRPDVGRQLRNARLKAVEGLGVPSPSAARPSVVAKLTDKKDTEFRPVAVPEKSGDKPKSLALFLRKVYHLACVRMRDLCDKLSIDSDSARMMWTCLEYTIVNHIELMQERHLDQIIMCAIYVIAKVTGKNKSFHDIIGCYRTQPQSKSHTYRSVLIQRQSNDSVSDDATNTCIRSSSALPSQCSTSQPPTPSALAGTESLFVFEDRGEQRGDIIHFYNTVYVKRVKTFALKFSPSIQQEGQVPPPLSPMPILRSQPLSPRRLSLKHSVFLSPIKNRSTMTPKTRMLYCFNRSPPNDLRAINNMLHLTDSKETTPTRRTLKFVEDAGMGGVSGGEGAPLIKRACRDSPLASSQLVQQRLAPVLQDRQSASGSR